jgi:Carbohydrate binding module (family 35)
MPGTTRRELLRGAAIVGAAGSVAAMTATTNRAEAADSTLLVDLAAPFRPVTRAAAGGLYALAEDDRPADSMLYPLRLRNIVQPAPGTQHNPNGQPPGGDSLLVASQAIRVGAGMVIRMPDIYPRFPYEWVSWDDWLAKVDVMVAAAGDFEAGWVRTFQRVRSLDPVTPIVGPSITGWRADWMRSFLAYARDHDALPDIICWHELNHTAPQLAANVAAYRALEQELGIGARPISINEYGWTDEIYVPGAETSYIAKLERAGVDMANRAFWNEYGTMNGLVVNNDQPTAHWWLYKWYGELAGGMVTTTPPTQTALDGFAAYDGTRRIVHVVFGNEAGTNQVRFTGLDQVGDTVRVLLESVPDTDRFTVVNAPTAISDSTHTVTDGGLTVPVPDMNARHGYHLMLEPTSGVPGYQRRYEAENAAVFRAERRSGPNASNGGYVGGLDNAGDFRTDSYVDFLVTVPTAGTYDLTIRYANGGTAPATHGLAYNGGAWATVSYPPTAGWGQFDTVGTTVDLRAGHNTIRLAKGSPYFEGGVGSAELDYIELG